jgi:hypothetical protein
MKKIAFIAIIAALTMASCGGGTEAANAEGFGKLEQKLKDKFGKDAYYTKISITYIKALGNVINATVTEKPESLKMGEWSQTSGNWEQTSELTLEVPQGTKAADFMFQLGDKVNLIKLGELAEKSKAQLTKEKNITNPKLHIATIQIPGNGDVSKVRYLVMLQPENGGTTFSFFYSLTGEFEKMNY